MRQNQKGFLLIEVLIAVLVLSISIVAISGVIGQVLHVSKRSEETVKAILVLENLLFNLETGIRPDLVQYGGREGDAQGFIYEIKSAEEADPFYSLKVRLSSKSNSQFLDLDTFLAERILQ